MQVFSPDTNCINQGSAEKQKQEDTDMCVCVYMYAGACAHTHRFIMRKLNVMQLKAEKSHSLCLQARDPGKPAV